MTVKDFMGHASIRITLDIYTHITEEFKENDMNKYNDFLKNTVKNFTEQPDIPAWLTVDRLFLLWYIVNINNFLSGKQLDFYCLLSSDVVSTMRKSLDT